MRRQVKPYLPRLDLTGASYPAAATIVRELLPIESAKAPPLVPTHMCLYMQAPPLLSAGWPRPKKGAPKNPRSRRPTGRAHD